MRSRLRGLLIISILLGGASGALAQSRPPILDLPFARAFDFNEYFGKTLVLGMKLEAFMHFRRMDFGMLDADGDGVISAADADFQRQIGDAMHRGMRVHEFLYADYDGDGVVTREEIIEHETAQARLQIRGEGEAIEASRRQRVAERVGILMRADRNGDGRLDWSEMIAAAQLAAPPPTPGRNDGSPLDPIRRAMLALGRDGKTTWAQYQAFATEFFRSIDTDGDGTLSREELEAHRKRTGHGPPGHALVPPAPSYQEQQDAKCLMPQVPNGAKVVLFGGHSGRAISTVALGGQDNLTTTARVTIEPGREPLYVVLAAYDRMIWRFDGEVQRVAKVVLMSKGGTIGLPRDAVAFGKPTECYQQYREITDSEEPRARAAFKRLAGREPDVIVKSYDVVGLVLPSGKVDPQPDTNPGGVIIEKSGGSLLIQRPGGNIVIEGGGTFILKSDSDGRMTVQRRTPTVSKARADLATYYSGGVVQVDPAAVVSDQPIAPYEVLPDMAGLVQLVESGAIELNRSGEYLIRRKIRFPAGLHGAHSQQFLLMRGVPLPDGDPGHSTVVSEETGDVVCENAKCR